VVNAQQHLAYLSVVDKELYDVTGMLPAPGGPARAKRSGRHGGVVLLSTTLPRSSQRVRPVLHGAGNLRIVMEEGGGRWGPPYGIYTPYWKPGLPSKGGKMPVRAPNAPPPSHDIP